MKKFYLLLSILATCLFLSPEARASHAQGADLTYRFISYNASTGQSVYEVTGTFYRDCSGGPSAPLSMSINITNSSCGGSYINNVNLPLINGLPCPNGGVSGPNGCEVSQLCPNALSHSTCNGGSQYPGVQKYVYRGNITLPGTGTGNYLCSQWYISTFINARNFSDNINGNGDLYVEAMINNTIDPSTGAPYVNSSAVFAFDPVPFVCSGYPVSYNNGATDVNGDSLVFQLIAPLQGHNNPLAWNTTGGFSGTRPIIVSNNQFSFNSATGQINFTPSQINVDVLALLVQEYRNGVLIGSVIRDVQVKILTCTVPEATQEPVSNTNNANSIDSITLQLCPGTPASWDIKMRDSNGDSIVIKSNITGSPSALPGATLTQVDSIRSVVTAHITWTPQVSDTGCHYYQITANTKDCPIEGNFTKTYRVCVFNKVTVTPHSAIYCGQPIQLTATGGTNSQWSPLGGLTFPTGLFTPLAAPSSTTTYTFSSDCGTDTAHIIYNPPFTMDAGTGGVICQNNSLQLNATVDNLYAPYQILWTPSAGLTDPLSHASVNNILNPVASPSHTTTYTVHFVASTGCERTDTVTVRVSGYAPRLQAKADPTHVCPTDPTQLTVTANPECGPATNPCTGGSQLVTVGTGTSTQGGSAFVYPSPYGNYYKSARHQVLFHASELASLIGSGGQITSVAMQIGNNNGGSTCTNFTIRMGCVDNSIDSLTGYVSDNYLTTVYTANYTTVNNWNTHILQTPYNWDGQSNLVIDFCFVNTTSGNINPKMKYTQTNFRSVWCTFSNDPGGQCGYTGTQQGVAPTPISYFQRPNFQFNVCTVPLATANLHWTPDTGPNAPNPLNKDTTIAHPVAQTRYVVTLTDNGCTSSDYVTVYVDTTVQLTMVGGTFICSPTTVPIQANARIAAGSPVTPAQLVYTWTTNPATATAPPSGTGPGYAHPNVTPTGTTTYIVTVSGPPGVCSITDSVIVRLGNGLPVQKAVDSITCSGLSDGQIAINIAAGTSPYTYTWSPPAGNVSTVSNLGPGTYYVTVTDAAGCTGIDTTRLVSPLPLVLTLDSTDVLCYGDSNGTATATVFGGRSPYRYTWTPAGANTNTLTGLKAGPYALTVTDTSGCTVTDHTIINQPTQVAAYATKTNLTGATTHDGTIKIHASGGTPGYTYTWTCPPPRTVGNVDSAGGLDAGDYYIRVCDNNGCCVIDTVHITVPPPINVVFTIQNVVCFDSCNGSISAVASGGVQPYSYAWSTTPVSITDTITSLCAGSYTLTVTDFNGISVANTVVVTSPPPVSIAIDSVPITCFGANNGSLDATPSGGTPTYNVVWSSGPDPLTNLSPGTYMVTVTDFAGCVAMDTAYLGQPTQVIATILSTDSVKCFGQSNGIARVSATGGRVPYSYQWSLSTSVADSATDLAAGPHTVTVTDASGCTATASFTIYQPLEILVNVTTSPAHCATSNDGAATAAVSNGTAPYTYTWDGTPGNSSITGLAAGPHNVVVADVNGCSTQQAFTIDTIYVLHISLMADSVNCNGGNDGVATVTVANGTPGYGFDWSPSLDVNNPATNLSAGMQTVTVTDAYGCVAIDSVEVFEPSEIVVLPTFTNPLCKGDANGTIWLNASGGHGPPYTYTYNGATYQMTDTVKGLPQSPPNTPYLLVLTDTRGCVQNIAVTLIDPPLLVVSSQVTPITCSNANDGIIQVTATGGTPSYTYTWSTGGASDDRRTNLPPGIYDITVTDANGCMQSTADTLVAPPRISVATLTADSTSCPGSSDGKITITVTGGTPGTPVEYEYSTDNTNWQSDSVFSNLPAGDYHLYARDGQYCTLDTTISVEEPLAITVAITPLDTSVTVGGSMQLTTLIGNLTTQSINSFSWSPSTGLSCIDCPNPVATPYQNITYQLLVNYGKNCFANASATLNITHGPDTYIPSGFSPNGDGNNDEFTVYGTKLKSVSMRVFNRWGEKVFDSMDSQWASWDGTYMGVAQPPSVYIYVVALTYLDGVKKTRDGTITLIR